MWPGFLPFSRASFMLDFVALAMAVILPVLAWSLYLVEKKRAYEAHRVIQTALASVLGVAIVLFEVDIRLHDWRESAKASPHYETILFPVLWVHLTFAVSTTILWIWTLVAAFKGFEKPARPGAHSRMHRKLGKASAILMFCTGVTGWTFYYLAFVAG